MSKDHQMVADLDKELRPLLSLYFRKLGVAAATKSDYETALCTLTDPKTAAAQNWPTIVRQAIPLAGTSSVLTQGDLYPKMNALWGTLWQNPQLVGHLLLAAGASDLIMEGRHRTATSLTSASIPHGVVLARLAEDGRKFAYAISQAEAWVSKRLEAAIRHVLLEALLYILSNVPIWHRDIVGEWKRDRNWRDGNTIDGKLHDRFCLRRRPKGPAPRPNAHQDPLEAIKEDAFRAAARASVSSLLPVERRIWAWRFENEELTFEEVSSAIHSGIRDPVGRQLIPQDRDSYVTLIRAKYLPQLDKLAEDTIERAVWQKLNPQAFIGRWYNLIADELTRALIQVDRRFNQLDDDEDSLLRTLHSGADPGSVAVYLKVCARRSILLERILGKYPEADRLSRERWQELSDADFVVCWFHTIVYGAPLPGDIAMHR